MAMENDPAHTYTIADFIKMKNQDEMTYATFGLKVDIFNNSFIEQTIIDYYLSELKDLCIKVDTFAPEEIIRYRYAPDLLAYDLYGSTQLDFIILLCNGIIDPKEFDFKKKFILLPRFSILKEFLSKVYKAESEWMKQ